MAGSDGAGLDMAGSDGAGSDMAGSDGARSDMARVRHSILFHSVCYVLFRS